MNAALLTIAGWAHRHSPQLTMCIATVAGLGVGLVVAYQLRPTNDLAMNLIKFRPLRRSTVEAHQRVAKESEIGSLKSVTQRRYQQGGSHLRTNGRRVIPGVRELRITISKLRGRRG